MAAPPERVYEYLTDQERWQQWQGVDVSLDPVPGGALTIEMGEGSVASGRFVELVPNRRVVFTWGWKDGAHGVPPGSSTVTIDLLPEGDGTLVRLTHSGLPPAAREPHLGGWEHHVERLAIRSEGGDPGPDSPH